MTPTIYPYVSCRDAAAALGFLEEAFGFTTSVRWDYRDGNVQHAEITFGEGAVMMGTAALYRAARGGQCRSGHLRVRGGRRRALRAGAVRWRAGGVPPNATEWGTRRYRVLGRVRVELWSLPTRHGRQLVSVTASMTVKARNG